jgi:hypothetical protein
MASGSTQFIPVSSTRRISSVTPAGRSAQWAKDGGLAGEELVGQFVIRVHNREPRSRAAARRPSTCPSFRGGDLVANVLTGDLPLELGEGQQNIEVSRPIEVVVLNC